LMAQTTSNCPRRQSPATKTPSRFQRSPFLWATPARDCFRTWKRAGGLGSISKLTMLLQRWRIDVPMQSSGDHDVLSGRRDDVA
ncbi:hypothetical protein ScalyP_jg81, partial [Parmales sp. scaly parma]